MDVFPDGAFVRLRSRGCDLYLRADEDGSGVSLSAHRASPRASWEVRRVERRGVVYVLLQSAAADGRYLAISADPAAPGTRGLRVAQSDGVEWSACSAGDGGSDVLLRHPAHGFLCPVGCHTGVGVRHRVNATRSLLARWSVEPAPVAPPPPSRATEEEARGGADQNAGPPRAPARTRRGRRALRRAWAPVLAVAAASRGPFWVPLVDSRSRRVDYVAHDVVVGIPELVRGGDLEARLGIDLDGAGIVVVLSAAEAGLAAAPASLYQRLRGRVAPRVAVFCPLGAPAAGGEREPEPELPVVDLLVARLDMLYQGMVTRHQNIREHVDGLRLMERLAREGTYDSDIPIRRAVEEEEAEVVKLVESYDIMKEEAKDLSAEIAGEGINPATPPAVLSKSPKDFVTRSIRRRLHRRQLLKEEKASKAKRIF